MATLAVATEYTVHAWSTTARAWTLQGMHTEEADAVSHGRRLWRRGCGVRILVHTVTVLQEHHREGELQ